MKKGYLVGLVSGLLMFSLSGMTVANAGPLAINGLIASYEFDGNANDTSGNNLNGTVYGATLTADRFGNPNSAYRFNGIDNYIEVADNNIFDLTNNFSISLWVKQYAFGGRLVDKTTAGTSDGYDFDTSGAGYAMRLAGGDVNIAANTTVSLNTWHHLVVTLDGGLSNFFLDGVWDGGGNSGLMATNDLSLRFGMAHPGFQNLLNGDMDSIYIYNRALTSSEVNCLYSGKASTPVPAPATMLLFGTGIAGLVGTRLKRKKQ